MPRGSKQLITAFIPKAKEQACMIAILLVYIIIIITIIIIIIIMFMES
jgi:hypothetical protein